jgi:hypothetical protein
MSTTMTLTGCQWRLTKALVSGIPREGPCQIAQIRARMPQSNGAEWTWISVSPKMLDASAYDIRTLDLSCTRESRHCFARTHGSTLKNIMSPHYDPITVEPRDIRFFTYYSMRLSQTFARLQARLQVCVCPQ